MAKKADVKVDIEKMMELRLKAREELAVTIQKNIDEMTVNINKFIHEDLETFKMLHKPDCLFYDSPLSQFITHHWITEYMKKVGLPFAGVALDGVAAIPTFVSKAKEARLWALRFAKEPEVEATGIDAIL